MPHAAELVQEGFIGGGGREEVNEGWPSRSGDMREVGERQREQARREVKEKQARATVIGGKAPGGRRHITASVLRQAAAAAGTNINYPWDLLFLANSVTSRLRDLNTVRHL